MNDRNFALSVSILSGIAFTMATLTPIVVDRRILSLLNLPSLKYPIGLWIIAFALPVALGVYIVNIHGKFQHHRALSTAIVALTAFFLSLLNYPSPAGIHLFVLGSGLGYSFMISLLVAAYHYDPKLRTSDPKIDSSARIERIRLEYETWFRAILTLSAFAGVPAGLLVFNAYNLGLDMYSTGGAITQEVKDASFLFASAMWIAASYFAVLTLAFLLIAFKKIKKALNELNMIEAKDAESTTPRRVK